MIPLKYASLEVDFTLLLLVIFSVPGDIIIGPVNLVLEVLSKVVDVFPLVVLVALCCNSTHVLLQVDQETGHDCCNIVPLCLLVFELLVVQAIEDFFPFYFLNCFVTVLIPFVQLLLASLDTNIINN